jgi:hypothetical protein
MQTSAHALHGVFQAVIDSNAHNLAEGWATALGCDYASAEFSRRHTECAVLLADVVTSLEGLTDQTVTDLLIDYVPAWWRGLFHPDTPWQNSANLRKLYPKSDMDALALAGHLLAASLKGSSAAIADEAKANLDHLREVCAEWIGELDRIDGLDESLMQDLRGQLRHVIWLIERSDWLGASRAARAAETAFGMAAPVTATLSDNEARKSWISRCNQLAGQLALLCGLIATGATALEGAFTATEGAIESGVSLVSTTTEVIHDVREGKLPDLAENQASRDSTSGQ